MKKLVDHGFFGAGLVSVRTPSMVTRYNRCLKDLGIEPTALASFQIDGMGWSPQVAEEKRNPHYLSHGEANSFAIVLSPDQEGKPIYAPVHSFDFDLMAEIFRVARRQIASLTTETAIWFDIDQQIDHYHSPLDLLMLEGIMIKPATIDRIIRAAKEQRRLVSLFREDNEVWMDASARSQLIESARTYGDLRYKPCIIPDIPFNDVTNFHTRAFGGIFVFRGLPGFFSDGTLLVIEDPKAHRHILDKRSGVLSIESGDLQKTLIKRKLAVLDLEFYRKRPELLETLKENLLAEAVYRHGDPNTDLANATEPMKKRLAESLNSRLYSEYHEIDRLKRSLANGKVSESELSPMLSKLLTMPNPEHPESLRRIVWMALVKSKPIGVERLYRYSKQLFYEIYQSWPQQKREWAVSHLKSLGLPNKD